jgi:hypothetical protein
MAAAAPAAAAAVPDMPLLLGGEKGKGLAVYGKMKRAGGRIVYQLHVSNGSASSVDGLMLQVRTDSWRCSTTNQHMQCWFNC